MLSDGKYRLTAATSSAERISYHEYLRANPLTADQRGSSTARAAREMRTVHIPDIAHDPEYGEGPMGMGERRALLSVPLVRDGTAVGVITLLRPHDQPFTARQIEAVETFADQAVIAVQNARLFEEVQARTRDLEESLEQQTATADVLKVISRSAFDLDAVLKTLTDSARLLSGAATAAVFLRDGEVLRVRAELGCAPEFLEYLAAHPPRLGRETFTGRVLMTGEAAHVPDVLADPDYDYGVGPRIGNYRAGLGVPLLREGRVDGVFGLMHPEPGAFTPRQIELLRTFADQAVIAIENTRLFDEVQARTRDLSESLHQQTATADVLKVISRSAFDLQAVFDALLASAVSLIGGRGGTICVRDGDVFRYRAVAEGRDSAIWRYLAEHPATPGRASVAGRVLLSGKPETVRDTLLDSDLKVPVHALAGARSIVCVPLLRDGRVDGALMVGRGEAGPFDDRQVELVQTFADQAVIAIENVRLFDEVQARTRDLQESLQQQTATADVLKVISRSAFDLQAVLHTLVELAAKLCDANGAVITREVDGVLYRAESYGRSDEFMAAIRRLPVVPERGTVSGRVLLEGKAIQIDDIEADPEYALKAYAKIDEFRTVLGIPMLRDGAPSVSSRCSAPRSTRSATSRSSSSRPSPTRPSSRSRTRGCSTRCRRRPAISPNCCSSRPRPPMSCRSSAARRSTSIWPRRRFWKPRPNSVGRPSRRFIFGMARFSGWLRNSVSPRRSCARPARRPSRSAPPCTRAGARARAKSRITRTP